VSGALAGLGGAFLAIVASNQYREGQTAGRGFIGLAAMIFGNWRPAGLAAGSGLFGYVEALRLRGAGVHALLLAFALGLGVWAVWLLVRAHRMRTALITAVVAVLVLLVYLSTDTVPQEIAFFTPHLTTLIVLALFSQHLRMPAADGKPYRRGGD